MKEKLQPADRVIMKSLHIAILVVYKILITDIKVSMLIISLTFD